MSELTDTYGRQWTGTPDADGNTVWTGSAGFSLIMPPGTPDAAVLWSLAGLAPADLPAAPVPPPDSVPTWQLQTAMAHMASKAGQGRATVLEDANAYAATSATLSVAWNRAPDIDRTGITMAAIAAAIGLTAHDIDALFIAALAVTT